MAYSRLPGPNCQYERPLNVEDGTLCRQSSALPGSIVGHKYGGVPPVISGARKIEIDAAAPHFGLPPSLWIPIAAAKVEDIESYVGRILDRVMSSDGKRVNAVLVKTHTRGVAHHPNVPIWKPQFEKIANERFYPAKQVWVHVDYDDYRQAYLDFKMPPIPGGYVLDHVQNRIAIRMRNSHPYLRLCPVRPGVNTSGGHSAGGEGMEKDFLQEMINAGRDLSFGNNKIIYADPMDLTKMLDIKPGTKDLGGVRDTQHLFYPKNLQG